MRPPKKNSRKNILNILNDDCLRKIFKKLSFGDLCSVLGVCVRFNRISKECLASRHNFGALDVEQLVSLTFQQAEHLLHNFNALIYKVEIDIEYFNGVSLFHEEIIFGMIAKHCKSIREFIIRAYFIYLRKCNEFIPIFRQLERLYIKGTFYRRKYLISILSHCFQLKLLSYIGFYYFVPAIKLPSLTACRFNC